jgi:hypothetical protein
MSVSVTTRGSTAQRLLHTRYSAHTEALAVSPGPKRIMEEVGRRWVYGRGQCVASLSKQRATPKSQSLGEDEMSHDRDQQRKEVITMPPQAPNLLPHEIPHVPANSLWTVHGVWRRDRPVYPGHHGISIQGSAPRPNVSTATPMCLQWCFRQTPLPGCCERSLRSLRCCCHNVPHRRSLHGCNGGVVR